MYFYSKMTFLLAILFSTYFSVDICSGQPASIGKSQLAIPNSSFGQINLPSVAASRDGKGCDPDLVVKAMPQGSTLQALLQACQDKQKSQAFSTEKAQLQQAYQSKLISDLEFARRSCSLAVSQLSCQQIGCAMKSCDMKAILFYAVRQGSTKAQCVQINDTGMVPTTAKYDQSMQKITNNFFTLPNGKMYCDTI